MKKIYLNINEAGIDEAGRGPLFGKVYAGAVIFGDIEPIDIIKDSKKLSKKKRKIAREWIEKNVKDYGVGYSTVEEIDEINILEATKLAIKRAISNLKNKPKNLIIDGVNWKFKDLDYRYDSIVKGDTKYYSIAAASILAKEYHDDDIKKLCQENEELNNNYDLLKNMGYGTKKHIEGIKKYGFSKFHRKSFKIKNLV